MDHGPRKGALWYNMLKLIKEPFMQEQQLLQPESIEDLAPQAQVLAPLNIQPNDVVTVTNPTNEDFYFEVGDTQVSTGEFTRTQEHRKFRYVVRAGQITKIEGYKAMIYIRKLVDKMMADDGHVRSTSVPEERAKYEHLIYVDKERDLLAPAQEIGFDERPGQTFQSVTRQQPQQVPQQQAPPVQQAPATPASDDQNDPAAAAMLGAAIGGQIEQESAQEVAQMGGSVGLMAEAQSGSGGLPPEALISAAAPFPPAETATPKASRARNRKK